MPQTPRNKLYCYVDETGQDTEGELFLVAVVILASEREELRAELDRIERLSGRPPFEVERPRPAVSGWPPTRALALRT